MATLDEVGSIVATACGLTLATNLFLGKLPATPDPCGALIEYPGLPPEYTFGQASIAQEHPRLQLAFRGTRDDYATPRALAELAYRALASASAQTIAGTRLTACTPLQPPFLLRREPDGRVVIGFNVEIDKELSAA